MRGRIYDMATRFLRVWRLGCHTTTALVGCLLESVILSFYTERKCEMNKSYAVNLVAVFLSHASRTRHGSCMML